MFLETVFSYRFWCFTVYSQEQEDMYSNCRIESKENAKPMFMVISMLHSERA